MTVSQFCDACGAALPAQATACPVCGEAVTISPAVSIPTSPIPPRMLRPIAHAPAPAPAINLAPGVLLAGRYLILEKIGEGGFGAVYKARDRSLWNELVAVKQINMASLSAQEKIEATDSYNRETDLLSCLRHKGLPRIRHHFTDPQHWYVVMDYIPGRTLEEILAVTPGGRLPLAQVLEIGLKLCDLLSYLHGQNPPIIFRDVKPGNIMLTAWGQLYLIDFGIARRYRAGQAKDTTPLGSPGYAAPEQYGRSQSSVQSDIYGLGATLQTLLTGKEPLEIRMHGWPPDCKIPDKLRTLIHHMLDPDPGKRPHQIKGVKGGLESSSGVPPGRLKKYAVLYVAGPLFSSTVPLLQIMTETHSFDSHFWLLYLLFTLAIILARHIYIFLHLKSLAFPAPTKRGMLKLLWQRVTNSLYYAILLFVFFEGIYVLLHLGTMFALYSMGYLASGNTLMTLLVWLVDLIVIGIELRRFWRWLRGLLAARRVRQQAAPPQQQQV